MNNLKVRVYTHFTMQARKFSQLVEETPNYKKRALYELWIGVCRAMVYLI